jgi:uncharacterized repeat protein (TIGR01451 family)
VIQATVTSPGPQTNIATVTHSDQFDPDLTRRSASATQTPQQADLALTKTVSNPTPNVGDTITYTVTLTNGGPDPATDVQALDALPAGISLVSATPSQGTYDPASGIWTVGTVGVGSPARLVFQAIVTSPNPRTNTATITHSDQFDPDTGNNTASATQTPQQADLALTKTVSNPTPNVGDTVTYTVTLSDNGPDTATNAQVTDLLPAGLTFDSATPSQGTYDPITGLWSVGTVAVGSPQTLVIQATVATANPHTNTATIAHSDQFDPDTGNNTATASDSPQQADLVLTKTVNNAAPNVGGTITFTIALGNLGPSNATNVSVTDALPVGLSLVSDTPSHGTYDPATGVWSVGTVAVGSPQTLVIQASVTSPSPQTNTATISHSDQFDPNPGNNSASARSVSNPTPNVGDTITYTVTLTDNGPDAATNAQVTDLLPAGVTFVSATPSQGTYIAGTGVWTAGTVAVGSPQTLVIQASVTSPSPQTNTAAITHSDQFDPVATNNTTSVDTTPQQADLALTKAVSDATPNVGDTISYTVTLSNHGPDAATGVQVTDLLPAGVTFVSAAPSEGTYNAASGLWIVGAVGTSSPQTLSIRATVVSPNSQTNTAAITHADQFDPDTANNTASTTQTPQRADLALAKSVNNSTPNVGDTITYMVTLSNIGPDAATGVQVTDLLPVGVMFVSATPSQGTYNSVSGHWTVGTVTTSAQQTLNLMATVVDAGQVINTATITHADQFDPDPSNNTASAPETAEEADLALAKTVNDPRPNVGETITYTITLSNHGPNTATGVQVRDQLPPGVTFVSAASSQGVYNSATGTWTVGIVTTAAPPTLRLTVVVVSPKPHVNIATIIHSDQFLPNPDNNTDSVIVTPQQAHLSLAKTVNDPTPNVGEIITYTLTLANGGPDAATNVQTTDRLPAGLAFVSAAPSQGTYNPTSGVWSVGTVTTSSPQTLMIRARVVSPGMQTNIATISLSDQFDPSPSDNTDGVDVLPQEADLALAKAVSDPTPNVGDTIAFVITLANGGPDAATGVQVTDLLPAGLGFVSAAPSQGAYNGATGLWAVGTLADGAHATLTVQARVVGGTAEVNTATIAHSDQFDPDTAHRSASVLVTPLAADLAVAKAASPSVATVGGRLVYTLVVANRGPATAVGVALVDDLPAGVAFVGVATTQGFTLLIGRRVAANLGDLASGATATVAIVVTPLAPGTLVNSALALSRTFDPDLANNTAAPVVTPVVAPPTVTSLLRFGFHAQPTTFVLAFSAPLDPASAQNPANYTLMPLGPRGATGAPIPIVAAVYNTSNLTVTLYPNQLVYLFARYRLVVNGSTPTGVAGATGVLIDGASNGLPGSNYVRDFGPEILAGPNQFGASPAVTGFRVATWASTAAIRSNAAQRLPSPTRSVPTAIASLGYGDMTARAVDRVLESFRHLWKWWA